ncbi:cytochrome P450 [Streptomyces sp. NPDC002132]|uniref:cytochrome P450 family protein n=1 Tax=unclassified Streptomyces TaxID=2593676 RepID=UPI0033324E50
MTTTEEAVAAAERCTPEYRSDPYPVYAHLREAAPVCPMRPPHGNETYLITRYEDAKAALADPRLSKDMYGAMDAYRRIFGDSSMALDDNMLNADPPKHTRLRRMVNSAFTPRRVQSLSPRIETVVAELLDACPTREPVDLLPAFAFPLPIVVICELLGVPPEDRSRMQHLSTTVAQTGFDPASKRAQQQAEKDLHAFFTELITAKRARPGDDLLSALIAVRDTDGDGRLTETELVSTAFLLMFAGHKTTAYLIGNAVHHLLSQPAQLRLVRDDPELLGPAIDELLRYDGSVESATFRYATEDIEYSGTRIPKGALVQIALNSANRDPRRFDRPDEFDVTRKGANAHLGFGHGGHYCLGAPLARLEMELALTALFDRFPRAALARPEEGPRWMQVPFPAFRGLAELPVVLDPAD